MIRAESASYYYQDRDRKVVACDSINLEINQGEFLGILGPSGSGKSTLLYLLSGLKSAMSGSISFHNRNVAEMGIEERDALRKSTFGFVFQHPLLLNYLSVIENVLLAGGTQEFATELLKNLGIGDKMHRFPYELSGGEKHRACIARALINRPEVIFADEPTASLDHANGESVVQQLRTLGTNSALVMVTHDTSMIRNADRIVHLQDGKLV